MEPIRNALLIRGARVMDPESKFDEITDLLMGDGRILKIGAMAEDDLSALNIEKSSLQEMQGKGLVAAPGFVDVHSHFRDPGFTHKEDILTGAEAAAAGGYTSIVLMANTKPTVDRVETLEYVLNKGKQTGIHIYSCANVTKNMDGKEQTDFSALYDAGAVGFTDDGKSLMDAALLEKAMKDAAALQVPVSLHEEDPAYITLSGINRGKISEQLGLGGADRMAEAVMVKRDIAIAIKTGAILDVQHVSAKETVDLIREAKKKYPQIHGEATPHHFSLTEEAVLTYGTNAKMNPPLRTEEDRQAILAGIADGTLDMIATDHAPHSKEEKAVEFGKAPSGIIGLETAFSLAITHLVKPGVIDLMTLLERLCYTPAKVYKLNAGFIREGGPADVVLFDPEARKTYYSFRSRSQNTPFARIPLFGEVECTICDGKVAYVRTMEA
ncbi:MAG: dihydroorotase [Lachnospiraceae bacterium]|nr:dihydroorotase [Lachnospiraceae bacterium]